jgi:predicted RNA-binding protein with PIN domain
VTSDYLQQTIVLNCGGIRMSTREFKGEIFKTNKGIKEILGKTGVKTNIIMPYLAPELLRKLEKLRRDKF